jgi:hypothetical protein
MKTYTLASFAVLAGLATADGVYTASNNQIFEIQEGIDRFGGELPMVYTSTFDECLEACAKDRVCLAVTYEGKACYMKYLGVGSRPGITGAMALGKPSKSASDSSTTSFADASAHRYDYVSTSTIDSVEQSQTYTASPYYETGATYYMYKPAPTSTNTETAEALSLSSSTARSDGFETRVTKRAVITLASTQIPMDSVTILSGTRDPPW